MLSVWCVLHAQVLFDVRVCVEFALVSVQNGYLDNVCVNMDLHCLAICQHGFGFLGNMDFGCCALRQHMPALFDLRVNVVLKPRSWQVM